MRILLDGQQLPVNIRVNKDLLQVLRSIAMAKKWRIHYDAPHGIIYLNTDLYMPIEAPDRQGIASIEMDSPRLLGKVVCLDPGHGGIDPGAIGPTGTYEKDNTLAIALLLREKLERNGAKVCMTRDSDRRVSHDSATAQEELEARVTLGRQEKADLFISIHNDSFINQAACGTTTYHNGSPDSIRLASLLQRKIVESLGIKDRGARFASFYVVRQSQMPSVLIEVAFISNPDEEVLLASEDGRTRVACGLFEGITAFFRV